MTCLNECATSPEDRSRGDRCLVACFSLLPGLKVVTSSGRRGTIVVGPGGEMLPKHCLVKFEDETPDRLWLLAEILKPAEPETEPPKRKRQKAKRLQASP